MTHTITLTNETGARTTSEYFVTSANPSAPPNNNAARTEPAVTKLLSAITNNSSNSAEATSFWTTIALPIMFGSVASRNTAISAATRPNNCRVNHQTAINNNSGITS